MCINQLVRYPSEASSEAGASLHCLILARGTSGGPRFYVVFFFLFLPFNTSHGKFVFVGSRHPSRGVRRSTTATSPDCFRAPGSARRSPLSSCWRSSSPRWLRLTSSSVFLPEGEAPSTLGMRNLLRARLRRRRRHRRLPEGVERRRAQRRRRTRALASCTSKEAEPERRGFAWVANARDSSGVHSDIATTTAPAPTPPPPLPPPLATSNQERQSP